MTLSLRRILGIGLLLIGISMWVSIAIGEQIRAQPTLYMPPARVMMQDVQPVFWLSPDGSTAEDGGYPVHLGVADGPQPFAVGYTITWAGLDRPARYSSTEIRQVPENQSWIATLRIPQLPDFTLCEVRAWLFMSEESFIAGEPEIVVKDPLALWSLSAP